jgi:hypothetical protein
MEAGAAMSTERRGHARERIAGAFVLCVLVVASVGFWVGAPLGFLWALSKLTDDGTTHFVVGLIGAPLTMVLFSPVLFWLNGLYLRVTGVYDRLEEDEAESDWRRRVRGPLEPILLISLVIAIVALCIWFFVFAENPPRIVW